MIIYLLCTYKYLRVTTFKTIKGCKFFCKWLETSHLIIIMPYTFVYVYVTDCKLYVCNLMSINYMLC